MFALLFSMYLLCNVVINYLEGLLYVTVEAAQRYPFDAGLNWLWEPNDDNCLT